MIDIEAQKQGTRPLRRIVVMSTLLALVLASCGKPDDQVCASYGYVPGTEGFGNCMGQRQQQRMQAAQMSNDNFNATQQRQVDIFRAGLMPQPTRLETTCHTYGNTTSCY